MFEPGDKVHCKKLRLNLIICHKDEHVDKPAYICANPFSKSLSGKCAVYNIPEKELNPDWVYWRVD